MTYHKRSAHRVDPLQFTETQIARFWSHVDKTDYCWVWTGGVDSKGYGRMRIPGDKTRWIGSHRFAYIITKGEIDRPVLDHFECDNPPCVNPDHLRPATQAENLARSEKTLSGVSLRRTHFACGHEITQENITWEGTTRRCKTCRTAYQRDRFGAEYQREYRRKRKLLQ